MKAWRGEGDFQAMLGPIHVRKHLTEPTQGHFDLGYHLQARRLRSQRVFAADK